MRAPITPPLLVVSALALACGEPDGLPTNPNELAPVVTGISPSVVDPAGSSRVRVTGEHFDNVAGVHIAGIEVTDWAFEQGGALTFVSPPLPSPGTVPVVVHTYHGTPSEPIYLDAWSPAELPGAVVFDAAHGVSQPEEATTYQWARLTPEIDPAWIHRDGPGLVYLPETGRFWMIAGWSPYEPPDGWGAEAATTNEVWSTADGITWRQELEHGHPGFDRRHFQGTVVWRDRVWLIGGDIFLEPGTYQHDVSSSADGVDWRVDLAQTPWSDRILHVAGVYNDRLWVAGGQNGLAGEDPAVEPTVFHNDVWSSEDGVTWVQVAADAPASPTRWSGRGIVSKMVEFKGRMWLIGGGTYDTPDQPIRQYLAETWSTTDGVTWTEHSKPPWIGRQYHTVEVFDDKLWVIGGCHEITCNSNDAWYSADGETWTEIPWSRSPLPVSHADGVAVGPDFLLFAGGNYSFGFGAGPDLSAWRLKAYRGAAVDGWVDRASGLMVTAEGAARPVLDPEAFAPGIPGLVFDGADHHLELPEADLQPDGRSVFFVVQSPYNPRIADEVSPANTVVGDRLSPYCAAGLSQGALTYTEGTSGWKTLTAGGGYQEGVGEPLCLGFSHALDGTVQAWADGVAVGEPAQLGYTPTYEGWRTLGASYGGGNAFVGSLGAVVILDTPADAALAARIHQWAVGRFGVR